jgi:hypothetical protein
MEAAARRRQRLGRGRCTLDRHGLRARVLRRQGTELLLGQINAAEVVLVVAIVFVAAFMARGAWLF